MASAYATMPGDSQPTTQQPRDGQPTTTSIGWARPLKQFGLFAAGAGFLAASIAISRRSVLRKRLETIPQFYVSNRNPAKTDSTDRSLIAVHAFSLATLNVMSFGIMLVGGISWGWDLSSVSELQARSRAALTRPGRTNPEDEREMEEMMNSLMQKMGMEMPKDEDKKPNDDKKE